MKIAILSKNGNKRQRIPKGQSKMDNAEKLATQSIQDDEKQQQKHNKPTICVGHHYMQTSTNNVNKTYKSGYLTIVEDTVDLQYGLVCELINIGYQCLNIWNTDP